MLNLEFNIIDPVKLPIKLEDKVMAYLNIQGLKKSCSLFYKMVPETSLLENPKGIQDEDLSFKPC
jgi:hypothetical protein